MFRFASHFSKRKTGKKKADKQSGKSGKPKGNGISPEGRLWEARQCRYAVVFWFSPGFARNTLAAFLPVDFGK
ncbi:MAG: hypothetical protein DI598_18575 [Pseudopedobacter saltans]|uniref:Uncharacterized protein n=1 Tax=Pseudopedobacter saltans TaxID=151895 RepID=A0A2W5GCQ9_9SPHI|nr:MAG: hypothetical protein DI598_18575 [Pseudopedobacter saltans]